MTTTLATLTDATGLHLDEDRGLAWVTTAAGELSTVDLASGAVDVHQQLGAVTVDVGGARDVLLLATDDGRLWRADPDDPAQPATEVSAVKGVPSQVALSPSGRTALLAVRRGAGSALHRLSLAGARPRRLAGTSGATGVAVQGRAASAALTDPVTGVGRLARLVGGAPVPLSGPLPPTGRAGSVLSPTGRVHLTTQPGSTDLTAFDPATGAVTVGAVAGAPGPVLEAHGLADGRVVVLTADALLVLDAVGDLDPGPRIFAPARPLFVGSWVRLDYTLGDSGLSAADVDFVVLDGPDAGLVSHTRENADDEPSPVLVAGGRPGTYKVEMVEVASGTTLAEAAYDVTSEWEDTERGPSQFLTGETFQDAGDSGWGGGPGTPQNLGDLTHTGTWNTLLVLIDTSTARWPAADVAQARTDVLAHVTNGFGVAGTNRSVREYYEENSNGTLTVGVQGGQVFGPVAMPNAWTSYFEQTVDAAGTVTDARWAPGGSTIQSVITQGINDGVFTTADLRAADSIIVVPRSPDASPAAGNRFAWPYASIGKKARLLGTNVMTDLGSIANITAPLDFAVHDGRQMHSTLSHELGHNLGLLDVYDKPADYTDDVSARITSDWEMMGGSRDLLPHFTVSNKMRMGWVDAGHLRLFNFAGSGAVDTQVTLHASELGAPPAGRVRGIEIRLGDGLNYYVEYRAQQAADISDRVTPDRRVVLTDVTSETYLPPLARPRILFVPPDVDGDGWLITTPADYEEVDPGTQLELKVTVVSTGSDNAVVRVQYGANGRPEPGIRPWDGGPTWKSPDIEIRNAKTAADPGKSNTPWLGHENTVVAKVRNSGDLPATGVVAEFFVTEYTSGDGPWVPLGTDTQTVPPGGAPVEFSRPWAPPAEEGRHYCVIVRLRLFQDPGNPAVVEHNIWDNEARSNYWQFVSASASPSTRVGAKVRLANPFRERTLVFADVTQTNRLHRVFVEHSWLRLDGQESQPVTVLDESLFGSREWGQLEVDERRLRKLLWGTPNHVSVAGEARDPIPHECVGTVPTGGAGLEVSAARRTRTEVERVGRGFVTGSVSFVDDGSGVPSGPVLVEVTDGTKSFTQDAQVSQGSYGVEFRNPFDPDGEWWVVVHFLGAFAASPSESERVRP